MLNASRWIMRYGLAALIALLVAAVSAPAEGMRFEKNVMVPMRDGVKLAANVFIPKGDGPFPVVLIRSPYGKGDENNGQGKFFTERGYAMVIQDCRGKFDSEGEWDPFRYDAEDGADTVKWIHEQNWCNGRVGTGGGSYVGYTQWALAPLVGDAVDCLLPVVPFSQAYSGTHYVGGAYQLALTMGWGAGVAFEQHETPPQFNLGVALHHLPLNDWDDATGKSIPYLRDWVAHSTPDAYWAKRGVDDAYEKIVAPILSIDGWYDIFAKVALEDINAVKARSSDRPIRRNLFCIMGPWGHGVNQTIVGDLDFGENAKLDFNKLQSDWYGYWLKDEETGVQDWAPYRLFIMGDNQWRDEYEWPLARTDWKKAYIHSGGKANTLDGDGTLSFDAPQRETPDEYTYDPEIPVPTLGGNNLVGAPIGPHDQREAELRRDVLVYTSEPLEHDMEVTGPVKMVLYAASSATDTDFTAKLVDVYPDGRAMNLCDGIIRARYRNSNTDLELIEPGKAYEYEIDLWVTANVFKAGHRVRLEVSSSNFPRFDRNPNTGHAFGADAETKKAEQTVYHETGRESYVLLPVIPR
ncbi:MAG: CocE/NonD family hydrolase [bacterium]|nr:CocE/NonD family hydrolase [bacterium]